MWRLVWLRQIQLTSLVFHSAKLLGCLETKLNRRQEIVSGWLAEVR